MYVNPLIASAERWIRGRNAWSGIRARESQCRQKLVVACSWALASSTELGTRDRLPRQRAEELLAFREHMPRPDVIGLDPEQHVGLQPHRLTGPRRRGAMAIGLERPLGQRAPVIEAWLAHELDLDAALDAPDGPHQHVIGVLVGRRAGCGVIVSSPDARPIVKPSCTVAHPAGAFHDVTSEFVPGS